jgi:glycerol-3-phosphate dehydrogenase
MKRTLGCGEWGAALAKSAEESRKIAVSVAFMGSNHDYPDECMRDQGTRKNVAETRDMEPPEGKLYRAHWIEPEPN